MTTPRTARKAAAKKAAAPEPKPDETPEQVDDGSDFAQSSVILTPADHTKAEKGRLKSEEKARAAALRAGHVQGLQNELAMLERQPTPDKGRISQVKAELDRYSDEPTDPDLETA